MTTVVIITTITITTSPTITTTTTTTHSLRSCTLQPTISHKMPVEVSVLSQDGLLGTLETPKAYIATYNPSSMRRCSLGAGSAHARRGLSLPCPSREQWQKH